MTLFVNACVKNDSRTRRLAQHCLKGPYEEVKLHEIVFPIADEAFIKKRDKLIASQEFDNPMFNLARQFANADEIVIAAPYWDLSFPASLKQYIEQINVVGITFYYTLEGTPKGLCNAKRLIYIMTAGGALIPEEFSFGYVKTLAQSFYGIPEVKLIKATGLDIDGADVEAILNSAKESIN